MKTRPTALLRRIEEDSDVPVSERIRSRLKGANHRYYANDNIAAFVEDGEARRAAGGGREARMAEVLGALVIDTESDHNTQGHRATCREDVSDRGLQGPLHAAAPVTEFPNVEQLNELMIVGPITVRSACSHHLCPILGKVWIGIMPNEHSNLIGLSKYARICDWVMSRPQIQEEAVMQLANDAAGQASSRMVWRS